MTRAETEALEALEATYRWLFDPAEHSRLSVVRARLEKTLQLFESGVRSEVAKRRREAQLAEMPAW